MPIHSLQPSFVGGEWSPSLYVRSDVQKFSSALALARNMTVHPGGGVSNRPGTYFVAEQGYVNTSQSRLISFQFNEEQTYIIQLLTDSASGNKLILSFFKNDKQLMCSENAGTWSNSKYYQLGDIVSYDGDLYQCICTNNYDNTPDSSPSEWFPVNSSWPYLINMGNCGFDGNGIIVQDLFAIKVSQSADVLFCASSETYPFVIRRMGAAWFNVGFLNELHKQVSGYVSQRANVNGPFMLQNSNPNHSMIINFITPTTPPTAILASSQPFFQAGHVNGLIKLSQPVDAQIMAMNTYVPGTSSVFSCSSTWRINISSCLLVHLQFQDDAGNWVILQTFSGSGSSFGSFSKPTNLRCVILGGDATMSFQVDGYVFNAVVQITSLVDSQTANVVLVSPANIALAGLLGINTINWSEGSWSKVQGFPRAVTFFQDRLCFSGSDGEPTTTWPSQTSNYLDFSVSNPVLDTDSISVPLQSRKINQIWSLVTLSDIIAFTAGGEGSIGITSGASAFSPKTVQTKIHGYRGSTKLAPVEVGNRAIFVQTAGTTLRDLFFDFQSNGYVGDDLTVYARHLFLGFTIKDMAYQQDPDSIVWAVRSDGSLLSMTYMKEQGIVGWTHHDTGGGPNPSHQFESVASIPNLAGGYDELWFSVIRGSKRFIEKMASPYQGRITNPIEWGNPVQNLFFVDAGITQGPIPTVPMVISAISAANPAVVTSTAHGLTTGNFVKIIVTGWTANNNGKTDAITGNIFKITKIDDDQFSLATVSGTPIDTTGYSTIVAASWAQAFNTVSGLSHLNGMTVSVLADGFVQTQKVVSSGEITLDYPAAICQVGLPYKSQLQTLPLAMALKDGTSQDRKLRINQVTLHFLNWRGGYLGSDFESMDAILPPISAPSNQPQPLYSGPLRQTLSGNYALYSQICIQQTDPLPMTLLGIVPTITVGGQ